MVAASQAAMVMSGKAGDAAFVDIRSIGGLNDDVNRKLTQQVCKLLSDSLGISPDRVYLNFNDTARQSRNQNGGTSGVGIRVWVMNQQTSPTDTGVPPAFLNRFGSSVTGVLSGFDRLRLRGRLTAYG
jgi:hypothetical protein